MLKKVAFVLALTMIVSFALAAESGPSNTVGFTKIDYAANYQTPFGVAFQTWLVTAGVPQYGTNNDKPSSVVGDQMGGNGLFFGDQIIQQSGSGYFAYHLTSAPYWDGSLETNGGMHNGNGMALWAWEKQGNAGSLVIAGEVNTSGHSAAQSIAANYQNPLTFREAREMDRSDLNLCTSGFSIGGLFFGDQLIEQSGAGNYCYSNSGSEPCVPAGWAGSLVTTTPGMAYWWWEKQGETHSYTYVPDGDVAPPPDRPGGRDAGMDRLNRPVRPSRSVR